MPDKETEIITPFDDSFYDPGWRYSLAEACAVDSEFKHPTRSAMLDAGVRQAVRHMKATPPKLVRPDSYRARFSQVLRWGRDGPHRQTGYVIEALLLTDAPVSAIAHDMGSDVATLELYEKLFFNVRDDRGNMTLAPAQKQFFATEGTYKPTKQRPEYLMWRRVAVSAGYRALIEILELGLGSWGDAPNADLVRVTTDMARAETLAKVAAGGLSSGELARLESNRLKGKLIRHQVGEKGGRDEGMELALKLVQLMAPKMVEPERISRAQALQAEESLHEAERRIEKTEVEDKGALESRVALQDALDKQLSVLAPKQDGQRGVAPSTA